MRRTILDDQEPTPPPPARASSITWTPMSATLQRVGPRPTSPVAQLSVWHISYQAVRKLISDKFGVGAGSSALVAAEYDEHPYMLVTVTTHLELDEVQHLEQFSQNIALASWETVRIALCYLAFVNQIPTGEYLIDNA